MRLNPTVGYYTHQRGHKETDNTLNGVEPSDMLTHTMFEEVCAHGSKVRSPYGKLQEVHHDEANLQCSVLHIFLNFKF